jgi:hypothetical protein
MVRKLPMPRGRPRKNINPLTGEKKAPPRRGLPRRKGVRTGRQVGQPDGMRYDEAEREWAFARMYANEVTKIMKEEGIIPEDPKVEAAFRAAIEVLESPMSQAIKLQASRLILDFCKAKPVAKSEVTVKSAEDWLAQVTADHLTKTENAG